MSLDRETAGRVLDRLWCSVLDEPGTVVHNVAVLVERPDGMFCSLVADEEPGEPLVLLVSDPGKAVAIAQDGEHGVMLAPGTDIA